MKCLALVIIALTLIHDDVINCQDDFVLTVLHTNDVHAHIEEFNTYGGTCSPEAQQNKECYGGVARRHTMIEQLRKSEANTILIDGGDQMAGTFWFIYYKGLAAVRFMNYTKYDAMAIGNHEFDNGPANLVQFMQLANFSIVCTNMDVSKEPIWPNPPIYTPSTVLVRGGKKIGIVGYTTPDIKWLSNAGDNIEFSDPVEGVRKEAQRLKNEENVDILIALGHAGYSEDQRIAKEVAELDLVVGGHTNTFLWNGPQPSVEKIEGPYPFVVEREDGTKCPVVQDFTYGKYLGNLKLTFDSSGKLKSWQGNPIMLNASIPEDPEVLKLVQEMAGPIIKARNDPVGKTLVMLEGDRSICRLKECNLGNFFADAIVRETNQLPTETQWSSVSLGLWNGGGIRSGNIDKNYKDNITREDLNAISPFGNTADMIHIKGKYLIEAFNHGFSGLETNQGRYPQVSGFRITYDKNKPVESRLVEARALCNECRVPKYELIEDEKLYWVVTSDYLADGGDGYSALLKAEKVVKGPDALTLLENHFKRRSPVYPGDEFRTLAVDSQQQDVESSSLKLAINFTMLFIGVLVTLIY